MRGNRIGPLLGALAVAAAIAFAAPTVVATTPEQTLLVTLRADASVEAAERLIQANGGRVLERLRPLPIERAALAPGVDPQPVLEALRASPLVRAVEIEDEQAIQVVPNDGLYRAFQW